VAVSIQGISLISFPSTANLNGLKFVHLIYGRSKLAGAPAIPTRGGIMFARVGGHWNRLFRKFKSHQSN
jgi:hypothetical protein